MPQPCDELHTPIAPRITNSTAAQKIGNHQHRIVNVAARNQKMVVHEARVGQNVKWRQSCERCRSQKEDRAEYNRRDAHQRAERPRRLRQVTDAERGRDRVRQLGLLTGWPRLARLREIAASVLDVIGIRRFALARRHFRRKAARIRRTSPPPSCRGPAIGNARCKTGKSAFVAESVKVLQIGHRRCMEDQYLPQDAQRCSCGDASQRLRLVESEAPPQGGAPRVAAGFRPRGRSSRKHPSL